MKYIISGVDKEKNFNALAYEKHQRQLSEVFNTQTRRR